MIDLSFWKNVKTLWIRNEDPTVAIIDGIIQEDGKSTEEVNELNRMLNGDNISSGETGSVDDLNRMMEQLDALDAGDDPFESMFDDNDDE